MKGSSGSVVDKGDTSTDWVYSDKNNTDKQKGIKQSIGMNRSLEGKNEAINRLLKEGTITEAEAEALAERYCS